MANVIDKVKVTVTGLPGGAVHAARFELVIAVNAIPYIAIELLPTQVPGGKNISVSSPSVDDMTSLFTNLAGKAVDRFQSLDSGTKATVKIEIERKGGEGGGNQEIELKDWVLTDATLSAVTSTAAPILTVILKHPIEVLDRVGEIYETPLTFDPIEKLFASGVTSASDMINLLDETYKLYAEDLEYYEPVDVTGGPAADSAKIQQFRKNISQALPSKYLKTESGVFMEKPLSLSGESSKVLKTAIASLISNFDSSIWLTLIRTVCPLCLMQVIPTYDQGKTLQLDPCSPWKKPEFKLEGDIIESVNMTSQDPDPICGVCMLGDSYDYPYTTDNGTMHTANQDKSDKPKSFKNMFYIPQGGAKSVKAGRIEPISENRVVGCMRDLNVSKMTSTDDGIAKIEDAVTFEEYVNMGAAYSKAMFECMYRRNCTSSVTTVLTFKDSDDQVIYPGKVLSVKIGTGGKDVLHGYLSRMVVRGSTDGQCTSTFDLITSRSGDEGGNLVKEGSENPCFK